MSEALFPCPHCGHSITRQDAAGYRIVGPDEVDPVTVEKCAEVVECATLPMGRSGIRRVLAAAIRALGRQS